MFHSLPLPSPSLSPPSLSPPSLLPSPLVHDCGPDDIVRPANGRLVDITTTTFGSVATFSCMDGFNLMGDQERRCELEGWTGSNPTCGELVPHSGLVDIANAYSASANCKSTSWSLRLVDFF